MKSLVWAFGLAIIVSGCASSQNEIATVIDLSEPPAVSPPPPPRELAGPVTYCAEGFALNARANETIRIYEVPMGAETGLYSTLSYPGISLVTPDLQVGVHKITEFDWRFAQWRAAFREYRAGKSKPIAIDGFGKVYLVTLHYEETGHQGQKFAYILETSASCEPEILALLSRQFDGTESDLPLKNRFRIGNHRTLLC